MPPYVSRRIERTIYIFFQYWGKPHSSVQSWLSTRLQLIKNISMVKIVHICGGLFLVLYLLYPNAVIIEECYEIIVLFYKMSKNSNKFTVQEVNMVLEN